MSFAFTRIDTGKQTAKVVMHKMAGICFGTGPSEINVNHYRICPLPAQNRVHVNLIALLRSILLACATHKKTGQPKDQAFR
jgi:hypothetical protein